MRYYITKKMFLKIFTVFFFRFNKFRLLFLLFVTLVVSACGGTTGSSPFMKPSQGLLNPVEGKALVRFLRPGKYVASKRGFAILDGEKAIGNLQNKTQFDYLADSGAHLFMSMAAGFGPNFLEAELEAGKTYYVIVKFVTGWTVNRAFLIPVDRNSKLWDKVEDYEKSLKKFEPNTKLLESWGAANKDEIQNYISDYRTKKRLDRIN